NVAVCPTSDNNVYFTTDGTFFKIQCAHHHGTTTIQVTTAKSFQECIDKCSQETACNSVNYVPASSLCSLLSSTGAATVSEASPAQNYAYKVDPPTRPAKDENLVVCSTSCPSANGQSYSSVFGETFRINCGKRHGTEYLKIDRQATLKDCMDSCASYIPCHSVDYQDRTRTCYYSNHHGEPTIITPGFSSAYSLGCTSSCCGNTNSSCRGCSGCNTCSPCIPPKPLGPPMPDLSCGNQGVQYAIYGNTKADGSTNLFTGSGYPTFDPQKFKTDPLQYSGTTLSMGFGSSTPIYGNPPADPGYVTVNHRAYIFAQQSGDYTFSLPYVDDISLLWVGPAAYSGFTRANANIVQSFVSGTQAPVTYTATFEEGKYYPMRVIWANGGGAGGFSFQLKGPDGKEIIGAGTTDPSPFLVQYSCDETTAPRFPPFGSET
ncbi:GLEYA domain-containing protein, partial [Amylocarpus encephaloides]